MIEMIYDNDDNVHDDDETLTTVPTKEILTWLEVDTTIHYRIPTSDAFTANELHGLAGLDFRKSLFTIIMV